MVVNFGENILRKITHTLVINTRRNFDHNNPNLFIEHDNIEVSIQALHDVESLDCLHTSVQQKVVNCTLRAASTLTQKLAEEAKLRVHDCPPKDNC
jgi:hypothetical protein